MPEATIHIQILPHGCSRARVTYIRVKRPARVCDDLAACWIWVTSQQRLIGRSRGDCLLAS